MTKENAPAPAVLERWGWASIGVNVVLAGLNLAIAHASGSLAVAAEMVHNLVDLVASIAVLVGLKLSIRRTRSFPYGLYKVENVVAAGIALLILLASYEIAREAVLSEAREPVVTWWILGGVALSILIPIVFSFFEMRAGRTANSPSLVADAKEYRVHVLTSGVVFCSLLAHTLHYPVDKIAALIVVLVVAKTGWSLLSDSMRVLLDASLDPATLAEARRILEQEPTLVSIHSLIGRNAGRYLFLDTEIEVKVRELEQADLVARKLERTLREQIPHVERIIIDVRPVRSRSLRLAIPLEKPNGPLGQHFGRAPVFLLEEKRRSDGTTVGQNTVVNPFSEEPKGRGIKVAHWLIAQDIDALITSDDVRDKGPGHALGEAGVDVIVTEATTAEEAVEQAWNCLD